MPFAYALDWTPYPQALNGRYINGGGSSSKLEESDEELDNEDLMRYYFYS